MNRSEMGGFIPDASRYPQAEAGTPVPDPYGTNDPGDAWENKFTIPSRPAAISQTYPQSFTTIAHDERQYPNWLIPTVDPNTNFDSINMPGTEGFANPDASGFFVQPEVHANALYGTNNPIEAWGTIPGYPAGSLNFGSMESMPIREQFANNTPYSRYTQLESATTVTDPYDINRLGEDARNSYPEIYYPGVSHPDSNKLEPAAGESDLDQQESMDMSPAHTLKEEGTNLQKIKRKKTKNALYAMISRDTRAINKERDKYTSLLTSVDEEDIKKRGKLKAKLDKVKARLAENEEKMREFNPDYKYEPKKSSASQGDEGAAGEQPMQLEEQHGTDTSLTIYSLHSNDTANYQVPPAPQGNELSYYSGQDGYWEREE
jgi:hypothetical protein